MKKVLVIFLSSCIPSGFLGKVLTPTGFRSDILSPGQVDFGVEEADGSMNKLVLLEATTVKIKEQFIKDGTDDRRIKLKEGYIVVDLYVRFRLPDDQKLRNNAFLCVTPAPSKDPRISIITLESIYDIFARMNVRGKTRSAFKEYSTPEEALRNMNKIEAEIGVIVAQIVKDSKMPLELMDVTISNIKEDQSIVESKNKSESALNEISTIERIGTALRNNPQYLEYYKWNTINEIMAKNPNATLIIDASNKSSLQIPIKK